MIVGRVDRQRRLRHAAQRRPQHLRRRQFYLGDRALLGVAKLAARAQAGEIASRRTRAGIALGFQVGNPDRAIDRADADRAVAFGQNIARRPFDAVLVMRAIEKAACSEKNAKDAGRAVRRADLPDDRLCIVPRSANSIRSRWLRLLCAEVKKRMPMEFLPRFFGLFWSRSRRRPQHRKR